MLRCNALQMCPRTTLAGFTPTLIWLTARLLVSLCQWQLSCCQLGDNILAFSKRCLEYAVSNLTQHEPSSLHERNHPWQLPVQQQSGIAPWSTQDRHRRAKLEQRGHGIPNDLQTKIQASAAEVEKGITERARFVRAFTFRTK